MCNQVTAVPCKHYNDLNHENDEWTHKMCRCVLSSGPVGVTLLGYVAEDANARHRRMQKRGEKATKKQAFIMADQKVQNM